MLGMRVPGKSQLLQLECKILVLAVIVAFASARSFHLQVSIPSIESEFESESTIFWIDFVEGTYVSFTLESLF